MPIATTILLYAYMRLHTEIYDANDDDAAIVARGAHAKAVALSLKAKNGLQIGH